MADTNSSQTQPDSSDKEPKFTLGSPEGAHKRHAGRTRMGKPSSLFGGSPQKAPSGTQAAQAPPNPFPPQPSTTQPSFAPSASNASASSTANIFGSAFQQAFAFPTSTNSTTSPSHIFYAQDSAQGPSQSNASTVPSFSMGQQGSTTPVGRKGRHAKVASSPMRAQPSHTSSSGPSTAPPPAPGAPAAAAAEDLASKLNEFQFFSQQAGIAPTASTPTRPTFQPTMDDAGTPAPDLINMQATGTKPSTAPYYDSNSPYPNLVPVFTRGAAAGTPGTGRPRRTRTRMAPTTAQSPAPAATPPPAVPAFGTPISGSSSMSWTPGAHVTPQGVPFTPGNQVFSTPMSTASNMSSTSCYGAFPTSQQPAQPAASSTASTTASTAAESFTFSSASAGAAAPTFGAPLFTQSNKRNTASSTEAGFAGFTAGLQPSQPAAGAASSAGNGWSAFTAASGSSFSGPAAPRNSGGAAAGDKAADTAQAASTAGAGIAGSKGVWPGNDTVQGKDTNGFAATGPQPQQQQAGFSQPQQGPSAPFGSTSTFQAANGFPSFSVPFPTQAQQASAVFGPSMPAPAAPAPQPAFSATSQPPMPPAPQPPPPVFGTAFPQPPSFNAGARHSSTGSSSGAAGRNKFKVKLGKSTPVKQPPAAPVPPAATATAPGAVPSAAPPSMPQDNGTNGYPGIAPFISNMAAGVAAAKAGAFNTTTKQQPVSPPKPAPPPPPARPVLTPEQQQAQYWQQQVTKSGAHRDKGNDHYNHKRYVEAEAEYSKGLEALADVPDKAHDKAVLHSNRAGARITIGKALPALNDALQAVRLEKHFLKGFSRAATCYLKMGNFAAAEKILEQSLDKMAPSNASYQEHWKKLQDVRTHRKEMEDISQCLIATLWGRRGGSGSGAPAVETPDAILQRIEKLRNNVTYSEPVEAMRVAIHLSQGRYGEAADTARKVEYDAPESVSKAPWRMWLAMQARYMAGDMQAALALGTQLTQALSAASCRDPVTQAAAEGEAAQFGGDSKVALAAVGLRLPSIQEVAAVASAAQQFITLKEEGNAAIKNKQHQQAVDRYTAALAQSPPPQYAAVLHSNRAAANQGLGSMLDAVSDCARAKALDNTFIKACTRLASLLIEVRRPKMAQEVLEHLLKPQSGINPTESERTNIQQQLQNAKDNAKWQTTADHYRLLGLARDCSDDEVRKAYRKAALKHHPDKVVSSCKVTTTVPLDSHSPPTSTGAASGREGTAPPLPTVLPILGGSAAIEQRVKEEATWLFNLVSQANEELSDKARRRKVDMLLEAEVAPAPRPTRSTSSFYHNYDTYGSTFGFSTNAHSYQQDASSRYGGTARGTSNGAGSYGARPSSGATRGTSQTNGTGGYGGAGATRGGYGTAYGASSTYGRTGGQQQQKAYGGRYGGYPEYSYYDGFSGESDEDTGYY